MPFSAAIIIERELEKSSLPDMEFGFLLIYPAPAPVFRKLICLSIQ